jgi:hypothetical protein
LSDTGKRREYNLIYPSINLRHANPQDTKTRRPPPASASRSEADNDVAQIAALRKEKEERGTQWRVKRNVFESSIFEMQRTIRRLEQDIKGLATITAAEKAQKASENSWGTWLLSPLTKKVEESEDMKAHNARKSQERKIEQDLKERRLISQKTQLQEKESGMKQAKERIDAADLRNDNAIRLIEARIEARVRSREIHERLQKENAERERRAQIWQQQQEQREKQAQEAREALRKRQAEADLARQKEIRHQERLRRNNVHPHVNHSSSRQSHASATCKHGGWWDKVVYPTPCPECHDVWNYLLQCPGCKMKACPKCQHDLRPRYQRHTARTSRREAPRPRSPSPYHPDPDWFD